MARSMWLLVRSSRTSTSGPSREFVDGTIEGSVREVDRDRCTPRCYFMSTNSLFVVKESLRLFLVQHRTHDVQDRLGFKREGRGKETHLCVAAQKPSVLLFTSKNLSRPLHIFSTLSHFLPKCLLTYIFNYLVVHS